MRLVDVVRDAAKQWPSVDESKKKKLTEEYLKERTEYAKQLAAYESKLTVAQKEDIKMAKKDRTAERERRAIQKVCTLFKYNQTWNRSKKLDL